MSIKMIDTSEKFMCVVDNRTSEAEYDAYRITIPPPPPPLHITISMMTILIL